MKEKTCLGKRNHTRSRKIWSTKKIYENQQKIKAIFQLCNFDVWSCRPRTHQLWGSCTEERMGWSNDGRIPVDHEEWCLGYSSQTRKQECGFFEMDLQDRTWCRLKYWKVQSKIMVVRGFSQKERIDYEETFYPVARYTSIRTIMELSSMMKWYLH